MSHSPGLGSRQSLVSGQAWSLAFHCRRAGLRWALSIRASLSRRDGRCFGWRICSTGLADRRMEVAESRGNCKGKHVMNVELMLSRALAANDAGLMACHDRNSFHPEEFGRGGLAPGQSLDSAKRTQQVTVFSMNQI